MSWTLRYGILGQGVDALIETDVSSLTVPWETDDFSGYCAVDVRPDAMATTITKVDTGDGVNWANMVPSTGSGDFSFRAQALLDNSTGLERSMTMRISDDAAEAPSVDITVTQDFEP